MNPIIALIAYLNVIINPSTVVLDPGEESVVEVKVVDDSGHILTGLDYELSVLPPRVARVRGNHILGLRRGIGVLIASVKYRDTIQTGYGIVIVGRSNRLRVMVMPHRAQVEPGDTIRFRAMVRVPGNRRPIVPEHVQWMVLPAYMGRIDEDGLFHAADHKGPARIVAVATWHDLRGLGSAGLLVGNLRDRVYEVHITPRFARIQPGDTLFLSYTIQNSAENSGLKVKWFIDPPFLGHFEGNRFVPEVRHGRGAIILWVEDESGKFGFARSVVVIGRPGPPHRRR